jgi:short-subunit dehydrogenase
MRARGAGTIVNIGSTAGRYTVPGACAYHITKYGVEALSLSLRAEVAQFGVHVVLIDPTAVRTPFIEGHINEQRSYADDDPYAAFKRRHHEVIARLAKTPGLTIGADTVARVVLQVVKAKNPKPRYIVGLSGKATIWARALLTDRMWERIVLSGLEP